MGRQSHNAIERIKKIGSMSEADAKAYLRSEKRVEPAEGSAGSLKRAGSVDRRDGVEVAAAEIVLLYVGFPSLSEHERVCGIIRKEIATRGVRPLNAELTDSRRP